MSSFHCDSGPLSQKSAGHMQNRKTKTKTNPSPDPNRYKRRCPDPNARIQKFIHYNVMAITTFAIADLCDSGLSPSLLLEQIDVCSCVCGERLRIENTSVGYYFLIGGHKPSGQNLLSVARPDETPGHNPL